MMATVPHVTSGLGRRKFQADGFLLTRVYMKFEGFVVNMMMCTLILYIFVSIFQRSKYGHKNLKS